MSLIRRRIAERLVEARQKAALLTTFNEIDMSAVDELRTPLSRGVSAEIRREAGHSFVLRQGGRRGAAASSPPSMPKSAAPTSSIATPITSAIAIGAEAGLGRSRPPRRRSAQLCPDRTGDRRFCRRAESNKLEPADLSGGTFTISNGGIYGSLLSTPIVNPPQSGVLGLHAIQERPVARDGQVVIRPMMYVALTYDHRLIDGREAVLVPEAD